MLPAAREAQIDFIRLAGEEPSSLYFEDFLRGGYDAWPRHYQERFPGLVPWQGVASLKQRLRAVAGAPHEWKTLIASRSLSLLKLGASCLFRVCRNVLTTDLSWPTYQRTIVDRAIRTGNQVTETAIRDRVFNDGWNAADVAGHLAGEFIRRGCDGLFLPAVDHLGIRMPIRQIVKRIKSVAVLRFCLIDAAQAFCHVPLDESFAHADFVVAGSHKWMGAYLPIGIGLFGRLRTRGIIAQRISHYGQTGRNNDPLLRFTQQLGAAGLDGHSETANLTSIFACAGALLHQLAAHGSVVSADPPSIDQRLALVPRPTAEWHPRQPNESLRSQIVLFESKSAAATPACPEAIRRIWLNSGCVVTGYPEGRARISLPR